jgi:vitamin B12/bleomycin/antimicrobial peptide transport system ATP-binding/permease protein
MECRVPRRSRAAVTGDSDIGTSPQVMNRPRPLKRFWASAAKFWRGSNSRVAKALTCALLIMVLLQLLVQYWLNLWNRNFFDSIGHRDSAALFEQSLQFVPLAASSVALAVAAVWGRMTMQRRWRAWLSERVLQQWMTDNRWKRLRFIDGEHENPEFRIAEDIRIATDAPIDLSVGFLTSLLTALTFIHVLWRTGGSASLDLWGYAFVVPGYLVVGAILYSIAINGSVMLVGRALTAVVESKNETEARLRATAGRLRESGEAQPAEDSVAQRLGVMDALHQVIAAWRALRNELMRVAIVSNANNLLAPVVGLALAAPRYLAGERSLGELAQLGAAFVLVSTAFNWIADNYPRLADWSSSARRVGHLLLSLDRLDRDAEEGAAPTAPAQASRRMVVDAERVPSGRLLQPVALNVLEEVGGQRSEARQH